MAVQQQQLLKSLQGASAHVPDLHLVLSTFPQATSPQLGQLRHDVDAWLESLGLEGSRLKALKKADMAMFGACWWPYAPYDRLTAATKLAIWLFAWDDETDSQQFSSLQGDFDSSQSFRQRTLDFIQQSLGLTDRADASNAPQSPLINAFRDVADAVVPVYSIDQLRTLYRELEFYLHMTKVEQQAQLQPDLPSVSEYSRFRMGTSAVGVCLALTEYCYDMQLPAGILQDPDVVRLMDECNLIVSTVNDVLSIKKEIAVGQLATLVPLLCAEGADLQAAVDIAVRMMRDSAKAFDDAAAALQGRYAHDEVLKTKLDLFVVGCRYPCTATLDWSLLSERYLLDCKTLSGGITIGLP